MSALEIVPTVVPQTSDDLATLLERCSSFAKTFHIDAADGVFAPNKTWMPAQEYKVPQPETILYEAHLMIKNPEIAGLDFVVSGVERIIAHVEAFDSFEEATKAFATWRVKGAKEIGIAALIETPLEALEAYVGICDSVTLMTIAEVGRQGIPFDERGYGRVADLHARYPDLVIEVDGGVGETQIATLTRAGARRFSVGSALSKSADPAKAHKELLELAKAAL